MTSSVNPTGPMCLEHFLGILDTLPQPATAKAYGAITNGNRLGPEPTVVTRRQPSRGAKKPTDFYELENPGSSKHDRDGDTGKREAVDYSDGRPPQLRRDAIREANYDVDLTETGKPYRSVEITWAADQLVKKGKVMGCCFLDQVVVCSACELQHLQSSLPDVVQQPPGQAAPEPFSRPTKRKREDDPVGPNPAKKRIYLVGRLAPQASMEPVQVLLASPPRWDLNGKGPRPSMMVRFGSNEFAVDFCKRMMFIPVQPSAAVRGNTQVKLVGRPKGRSDEGK